MAEGLELDGHHRATLEKIFRHPAGHNIQWHDVFSLLERVGTVTEVHGDRYKVKFGFEIETFHVPHPHDLTEEQVIDLRRMLKAAGITPDS